MREPPVLALFNPATDVELHTDAASSGLAGMLLQADTEGRLHLVRCTSRKCSVTEAAYHFSRLELLAITYSLDKFRPFLIGRHFKLVTDCQALLSINTGTTKNPQMARWCALIQEFQFTVEHRAGTRMTHVDALSRNPTGPPAIGDERIYCGLTQEGESDSEDDFLDERAAARNGTLPTSPDIQLATYESKVRAVQMEDPKLQRLIDILRKPSTERLPSERGVVGNFELFEGCLYRKFGSLRLFVIPDGLRKAVTIRAHGMQGYFCPKRTREIILRHSWFPRMSRYISDHIRRCIPCLAHRRRSGKQPGVLQQITVPERPFDWIHMDHVGPYPTTFSKNTHILVIIDRLTRFSYLEPVRSTSAGATVEAFQRFLND